MKQSTMIEQMKRLHFESVGSIVLLKKGYQRFHLSDSACFDLHLFNHGLQQRLVAALVLSEFTLVSPVDKRGNALHLQVLVQTIGMLRVALVITPCHERLDQNNIFETLEKLVNDRLG